MRAASLSFSVVICAYLFPRPIFYEPNLASAARVSHAYASGLHPIVMPKPIFVRKSKDIFVSQHPSNFNKEECGVRLNLGGKFLYVVLVSTAYRRSNRVIVFFRRLNDSALHNSRPLCRMCGLQTRDSRCVTDDINSPRESKVTHIEGNLLSFTLRDRNSLLQGRPYGEMGSLSINENLHVLLGGVRANFCGLRSTQSRLSVLMSNLQPGQHQPRLLPVNIDLPEHPYNLKKGTDANGESQTDYPSVGMFLFRVLALFFCGFCIGVHGAWIYHQRRRLGAALIALGLLLWLVGDAYFLLSLTYDRVSVNRSSEKNKGYDLTHNSVIVPQITLDSL